MFFSYLGISHGHDIKMYLNEVRLDSITERFFCTSGQRLDQNNYFEIFFCLIKKLKILLLKILKNTVQRVEDKE